MNKAIQLMMMDILEHVLQNADNPSKLADYLTEQLREIIGGRSVILIKCEGRRGSDHKIVSICPARNLQDVDCPELHDLCEIGHHLTTSKILRPEDLPLLAKKEWGNTAIQPLNFGEHRFGLLLILDLIDLIRVDDILQEINSLSKVIALTLKTSIQFNHLEQIIESRTHELSIKEHQFRTIAEHVQIGIFKMDANGNCIYINPYWSKITGFSAEDAYENGWIRFVHPEDVTRVVNSWKNHLVKRTPYDIEFRFITANNTTIWIHARANEEVDADQKTIIGHVGTFLDLTAQKVAEKELERAVQERKKNEEQLARQQKLESLGILAGGIAHDFNNLLTGLFGFIELAQRACDQDDTQNVKKHLAQTEFSFKRAKDLAQQLLTFSKGGEPIKKVLSVKPLLEHSAHFALSGSNIIPQIDIAPDLWNCLVDENQIGQVIDNLVINAKQAMPSGGILKISAKNLSKSESRRDVDFIEVMIEDQGVGIPNENLPHIFDPFFTTKAQGSGLGLSIVYSIIKKHGGIIEVKSEENRGTSFHIYLMRAESMESPLNQQSQTSDDDGNEHILSNKVLIMDDEETLRYLYTAYFEMAGCSVQAAQNGEETLQFYNKAIEEKKPFQIVMLDLTIPGGDGGKEIVLELRKLGFPFYAIAASGHTNDAVMSYPDKFGFDDVLLKPFRFAELEKVLRRKIAKELYGNSNRV